MFRLLPVFRSSGSSTLNSALRKATFQDVEGFCIRAVGFRFLEAVRRSDNTLAGVILACGYSCQDTELELNLYVVRNERTGNSLRNRMKKYTAI